MAGFIRRFGFFPGSELIQQIEGTVIVDLPPPGSVQGIGVGTTAIIGEFSDMSSAIAASSAGVISTEIKPQEIFTAQDLINKMGGFDETLGDFGGDEGNGFVKLRNKRFSRLVAVAVNLASAQGSRFFRDLPVSSGQTDTTPVVPVQSATISAGREFRNGVARFRIAARKVFTARTPIATGTGGSTTNAAPASTQNFTAAGGFDWTLIQRPDGSLGAREGDILVIGNNNGGALEPLPAGGDLGAGTYRVVVDPSSGNTIAVELLESGNFAFVTAANVPWRLHFSTDADTAPEKVSGSSEPGGYSSTDVGGFIVPIRPLTDASGAQMDGSHTAFTSITPLVVPAAITGDSANPLSGLRGKLHAVTATVFTVAVQGLNAASSAALDAVYTTAFDALLTEDQPARDVNIVLTARHSSAIRSKAKSHVLAASEVGLGRISVISPSLDQQTVTAVIADADPGVGANRDERVIYTWPGATHFVPEAVNFLLGTADGQFTDDGLLDDAFNGFLSALLSNLPPERNPGQATDPVPTVLASVLGFQRGVSGLGINEYIRLRDSGIAALRLDRNVGPIIQSGVTTSLISGEKNINRRRMADFIQDSLANRLVQFSKQLLTNQLKDTIVGETDAFLNELLSPNNPIAQRISAYEIDDVSGNTPDLEAKGIFVVIVRVRTLATADFIVLQTEIGEGVEISEAA